MLNLRNNYIDLNEYQFATLVYHVNYVRIFEVIPPFRPSWPRCIPACSNAPSNHLHDRTCGRRHKRFAPFLEFFLKKTHFR